MGHVRGDDHHHLKLAVGAPLLVAAYLSSVIGPSPGAAAAAAAGGPPLVEPEVSVTATDLSLTTANNSPMLAADPTDARFVVAAHRFDSPTFGCGLQVSGNGGRGWVGAEPVPELPPGAERCYAPEVAFDRDGTLYYLFIGLAGEGNQPSGVFLTTSTNRARTFATPWQVLGPDNYMARLAIDPDRGPRGRLHLVWLHASVSPPLGGLAAVPNPILSAHSDDGGRTFSQPAQVSDAGRPRAVAPSVAVGPGDAVHVAYYDLGDDARDYQGLEGPTWEGTWSLVVSTSRDGGNRFDPGVMVDGSVVPSERVMLIYTMPPPALATGPDGTLYAAWPDAAESGPSVMVARSTDGGRTFEAPQPLNDDTPTTAVTRELPRLGVAPDGRVDAAWLDRRKDPENLKYDVYYTSSRDGGRTFAPNTRLTVGSSDSRIGQNYDIPSAQGLSEHGSRLAVLSTDASALIAWPDTRNASFGTNQQDVFATRVVFASTGEDGGGGAGGGDSTWLVAGVGVALAAAVACVVAVGAPRARRRRVKQD